eukprot:3580266-Amphidinium_carterae.2
MRRDAQTLCQLRHEDLAEFGELKRERSDPAISDENSLGAEKDVPFSNRKDGVSAPVVSVVSSD